jgi:hypothetical protein
MTRDELDNEDDELGISDKAEPLESLDCVVEVDVMRTEVLSSCVVDEPDKIADGIPVLDEAEISVFVSTIGLDDGGGAEAEDKLLDCVVVLSSSVVNTIVDEMLDDTKVLETVVLGPSESSDEVGARDESFVNNLLM